MNSDPLTAASVPDDSIVRDDQAEFYSLLDAAGERRGRRARLKLIDTGRLPSEEMNRLGRAGVELYCSDRSGRTPEDLAGMIAAAKKGGGLTAYFHHGPLGDEPDAGRAFDSVREIARRGARVCLSNKTMERNPDALRTLAGDARRGRNRLVFYHHGVPSEEWEEAARTGVWFHFALIAGGPDPDVHRFRALAKTAASGGAGLILHLERRLPVETLEELLAGRIRLQMFTPPSDYRSPLRPLEERARRRGLPRRSYYLYPQFMC